MRRVLALLAAASALLSLAPIAAARSPQGTLRNALSRSLASAGGAHGAEVLDLTTGHVLFSSAASVPRLPASVEKLYTTSTALLRFGAGARLQTRVLGVGSQDSSGAWSGTLYLKGGGDPTFGSASFDRGMYGAGATMHRLVADVVSATGITSVRGRIVGDESTFDSLRGGPSTGFGPDIYVEGKLSALAYDRGFVSGPGSAYQSRPALFATKRFVSALKAAGVKVARRVRVYTGKTPAAAQPLGTVHSPRMATLIRLTNAPSDNFFAETLLKDVSATFGDGGTTADGARVVRSELASSFGISPQLDDGSGLSRTDLTSPRQVVALLKAMARNQDFTNSLAVAGESGTMEFEDTGTVAAGNCRGKTGSLHDVANLVGYCTARDGHQLAFAFLLNSVDPTAGHAIEDRMMLSVARYRG